MATGLITNSQTWTMQLGVAGFPAWTYSVHGTLDPATWQSLSVNTVHADYVKFTRLPGQLQLVAMRTDGKPLVTVDITPTGYARLITGCVKLGPIPYELVTPVQASGDYSGYCIVRYTVRYQQLQLNHYETPSL